MVNIVKSFLKKTLLPFLVLTCISFSAFAEPKAIIQTQDITVIVYDEKCEHPDKVSNLPMKITWKNKQGKVFNGCFGVIGPIVIAFFPEDKTIAAFPIQAFQPISNI